LAKYTTTYEPKNLKWISDCCYPVSGSLSISNEGRRTGGGTITFNGCALASAEFNDGTTKNLIFNSCE